MTLLILCVRHTITVYAGSPVLVDVNNDGNVEVLVAVSYYFDKEEYQGRELDFDPSLYVAGGLACWNLQVNLIFSILFLFLPFYLSLLVIFSFHLYFRLFYFYPVPVPHLHISFYRSSIYLLLLSCHLFLMCDSIDVKFD